MLQVASTQLLIPEPSDDLLTNEPWSIDIYADGLMDELFADIDYILDGSGNLPSQTVKHSSQFQSGNPTIPLPSEYVPVQTFTIPQIVLPKTQNRPEKLGSQEKRQQLSTFVVGTSTVKPVSQRRQKNKQTLGRLLVVGTTLGVAIAGIIYLLQSGVIYLLNTKLTQSVQVLQPQPQLPTKAEVEAQLIDYMLGALAVIDKQEAKNQKSATPRFTSEATSNQAALGLTSESTGNLPPLLAANNTPLASNRSRSVIENVYIPVYRAPLPMRYALPSIPGSPTLPPVATALRGSQPNPVKTVLNTVRQAAKPVTVNMLAAAVRSELKPVAVRTAAISVRQAPNPLPALPVVPLRPAPAPEAAPDSSPTIIQEQVYVPTAIADSPSNTLEGLLELGSKSAALFKIDGVTRRINMGENIGSSGWTLVEVSNGEAVIRRNGEVRSIYTGQKL